LARRSARPAAAAADNESGVVAGLRIIGGTMRGRSLAYSGDPRTRPMKERVREAVFNLLGPAIKGKHAIDLFAGTGALAFEALSRGAARATLIERHFPTARIIEQNAATLEVAGKITIFKADAFVWARRLPDLGSLPWVVFCSPPFAFYTERRDDMLGLIRTLMEKAPAESQFMVEADESFDMGLLPQAADWDVRTYPPAVIAILHM
jgi:16S rRNA (guanine966-N2)-methyltransferase